MITNGSVVAGIRTAELEHLETLLGHHKRPEQTLPRSAERSLQTTPSSSGDIHRSERNNSQSQHGFAPGGDDLRGEVDFFNMATDDILALAQEFEHEDPSTWVIFDERS